MNLEEKLEALYKSLEQVYEEEKEKRLELALELKGYAKVATVAQVISIIFRGLIISGILFLLVIILLVYSYRKNKAPKKTFIPLRARDYINQQVIFNHALSSTEPFILVLRSFEQARYLPETNELGDLDEHVKKEPDYEEVEGSVTERLENFLNASVKLVYVGKTRNCCSLNRLTKSLFLISDKNWLKTVEVLIEKSLFIVLMPGNTKGLLDELNHISKKGFNKTYFFLPVQQHRSKKMIDSWLKTYEEFQNAGLMLPYENRTQKDCIFKIEGNRMDEISFVDAYKIHSADRFAYTKDILVELLENGYIYSDYYKECLKYFDIKSILKKNNAKEIFTQIRTDNNLFSAR